MRNPIYQIWHPTSNVEEVTALLLKESGVRVSRDTIRNRLIRHPHFPSLASVGDIIRTYGVESMALKVHDICSLADFQGCFIVQIKDERGNELLGLVYSVTESGIEWYNPKSHQRKETAKEELEKCMTGFVLLSEPRRKAVEANYTTKEISRKVKETLETLFTLYLPALSVISILLFAGTWADISLTILATLGFVVAVLSLLFEYNSRNSIVNKLCGIGKTIDCNKTLSSDASRVFGIPWAVIGISYFAGVVLSACLSMFSDVVMSILACIHLLTLPYVGYSVYYQKRIAKHWCPLCLTVLFIIVMIFVSDIVGSKYHSVAISLQPILLVTTSFAFSFASAYFLWKFGSAHKSHKQAVHKLQSLKYNKGVFEALLHQGRKLEVSAEGVGILLGNPKGNIRIIEVCQPYCIHCIEAHSELTHIVRMNPDVRLQIIFMVDPEAEYYEQMPVDQFVSLYHEGAEMDDILSDWFLKGELNMKEFVEGHPANACFTDDNFAIVEKMYNFCLKADVIGTPTVYVNGYQLPSMYQIEELQYVLL